MINQQTKSVSHYRDLLQNIEEGWASDTGESLWKWAFGKSAKEISEKLGPRAVTIGSNGEKQVWKQIDNGMYELEGVGTKVQPEDLAKMRAKRYDVRDFPDVSHAKPRYRRGPGGQGYEQQNANGEWVKWEKPVEPIKATPEPHVDFDNIKPGEPHDHKGQLEPKLDGSYTAEELWKAAAAKQAYVESMIKSGKGKFKEKAIQDQVDAGVPLLDAVDSLQPGKGVKQKIENDPKLKDKFFGAIESAWRKGKRVIIVAILIAIGLWLLTRDKKPDDKKTGNPAQGAQDSDKSSGESSASGTSLAADEIPWLELGINPKAYEGSTLTQTTLFGKVIDDNWVVKTPQGTVGGYINDPDKKEIINKVLAMTPEERRAYKIESDIKHQIPAQGSEEGGVTFVPTTQTTPGIDLPTVSFKKPTTVPLYKDTEPPKTQIGKDSEVDDIPVMTLPSKSKKEGVHRGR
jgi:hypothetical protein